MAFTPYKLRIEFGGLCMLVQRDDDTTKGFFALMPVMDDPGMKHEPMLLVCDPRYVEDHKPHQAVKLLDGGKRILEWSEMAEHGTKQDVPTEVPSFVEFGKKPVNPRYFKKAKELPPCLAARVDLPLGATIALKRGGCVGIVTVEGFGERRVVGEAIVELTVTEERFGRIDVGMDEASAPVILQPADTREGRLLEIRIVNIIPDHVQMPGCTPNVPPAEPRKPLHHVQSYYHLLENRCEEKKGGPVIIAGDEVGPCAGFINPYQCTLGTG